MIQWPWQFLKRLPLPQGQMSLRPTPAKLRLCGRRNGGRVGAALAAAASGAFAGCATSSARPGFATVAALLADVLVDFFLLIRSHMYPPGGPSYRPWHFLYFLPLPHQQGSLRPSLPAPTGAVFPSTPLGLAAVRVAAPPSRPRAVASAAGGVGVGGSLTSWTRKTVEAMSNWMPLSSSWNA